MRYLKSKKRRHGAIMLENALVLPILITILGGTIVGGMGVFRYQQMVALAREGARYASVHGLQYQADNPGKTAATVDDVFNNAILPMAAGLDTTELRNGVTVTWPNGKGPVYADPNSNPPGQPIGTTVVVTVSYSWIPAGFFGGARLTSTSIMPMQY